MSLETKRVLITVKAYPNPSKKYVETVCCAGIDLESHTWIRLFPVPFRDLDSSRKFKKYDVITVKCHKASKDHRVESYHIDQDTIEVVRHIDTKNRWRERKDILLPTTSQSFCQILTKTDENISLGMFKPSDIQFSWQPAEPEDEAKRQACYGQLSFFDKRKNAIERVPFDFYYTFRCAGTNNCPGHRLKVVDWELGQAYRRWRTQSASQEQLLEKIHQKWLTGICSKKNDIWFYVGNMHRFRDQFLVLGVFYPPKPHSQSIPTLYGME